MKIKNVFLASLLTKMGVEAKAELVVDDANGVALTFPDISEVSGIVEDVAIDAADGTYVIADGENTITIVVLAGVVSSVTVETPAQEVEETMSAEVAAVLETVVEEVVALKSKYASVVAELKDLKVSLKHETKEPTAAAADKSQPKFKVIG
jgi:hypothetical protein